jgi:hypothetical protein
MPEQEDRMQGYTLGQTRGAVTPGMKSIGSSSPAQHVANPSIYF